MTAYDYHRLSPQDFEHLAADLLGAREGMRFERFAEGPDGGIDLRHRCEDGNRVIAQAKRIADRDDLRRAVRAERVKLDRLEPSRYLLVTCCPLTPPNKCELQGILEPYVRAPEDIVGREELDALLAEHPNILRRHVKLWLQDGAQLRSILHQAEELLSEVQLEALRDEAERFVHHRFVDEADARLARYHCCLVTGGPGVGKTALAGYLALRCAGERGHQPLFVTDRNVRDAWKLLDRERQQVIVLDDFLGAQFLDTAEGLALERQWMSLVRRITKGDGRHKLLMTTRDYVLEQARDRLDTLKWEAERIARVTLEIGALDDLERARILVNHLYHAGTPQPHLQALVEKRTYRSLVQHENFTPRLAAYAARDSRDVDADDFAAWLKALFDAPHDYWRTAFNRLSPAAQHLLYALAAAGGVVAEGDINGFFHALHHRLAPGRVQPGALRTAVQEVDPNFATTERAGDAAWFRLSTPAIGDLLHQVIGEDPVLIDALIDSFDRFQHGLSIFQLDDTDRRPVAIRPYQRQRLAQRLIETLDTPALERRAYRIGGHTHTRFIVPQTGERLAALWRALHEHLGAGALATDAVTAREFSADDWYENFASGAYGTLLELVRHLPWSQRHVAWIAAMEALINTEDAAALAEEVDANPEASRFLEQRSEELARRVETACEEEVGACDDTDQLAAILQDIETIESALALDLHGPKYSAWERMEELREAAHYAEDEPLGASDGPRALENVVYIDALFSQLVETAPPADSVPCTN